MTAYEPGVCNIGAAERRKRYAFGMAGLVAAGTVILFASAIGHTGVIAALLLVTLIAGFEGIYQGYTGSVQDSRCVICMTSAMMDAIDRL
jgi:hypothetical protein